MREPGMYAEKVDEMRTSEPIAITKVDTSQPLAAFYEFLDRVTKYRSKMHMCSVCIETRSHPQDRDVLIPGTTTTLLLPLLLPPHARDEKKTCLLPASPSSSPSPPSSSGVVVGLDSPATTEHLWTILRRSWARNPCTKRCPTCPMWRCNCRPGLGTPLRRGIEGYRGPADPVE
uniref:Uncharacterized protein n=1 Tax=Vespula pensylvanica TaxID=30213 RepID=A0A834NRD5_VESPE|nr:hypothetical protein H0235_011056 [Vespula pensylvanica]